MSFYLEQALPALELPAAPTLIDPWMTTGSVTLVFGPPSAGKTMWTTTVARTLGAGGMLFGAYPCAQSRSLIIQADMPTVTVVERAQASQATMNPNVGVWLTDNVALDVLHVARTHHATLKAAQEFDPQVVFVDTLRKTHGLDENDSAAPDKVYAAWRALFPGASFVFNHHARKIPTQGATDAIMREAFRGSIAWAASADSIISIRRVRRRGNKDWLVQQRFVRTRNCEEPLPILLKRTEDLLLEPVNLPETLESRFHVWLLENPRATQAEGVKWLTTLRDDKNREMCGRRRAYRVWDRVVEGGKL